MKRVKKLFVILLGSMTLCSASMPVLAQGMPMLSEQNTYEGDTGTIVASRTTWRTPLIQEQVEEVIFDDGTKIIDVTMREFEKNPLLRSESGSEKVNRTRYIYGDGGQTLCASINIVAEFSWAAGKSYVDSFSASKQTYANWTFTKFDEVQGDSGLLNKAYAKVNYTTKNPVGITNSSKFEVTCSKTGTIADNN